MPKRRGHGVHRERCGHVAVDRGASRRHVEPHRAAGEALRVEPPHDGVRIRHRGVSAAAAITGRAGFGAGTGRSHLNAAQLVDRGDGATAGADFHHLDHRHTQRQAAALLEAVAAPHLERPRHQRCVVVDEADLRRGAPHVERQRLGEPQALSNPARQDGAAGRPGFHQPDGEARRRLDIRQAAAGSHHQKRAIEAARREVGRQLAQVTRHERLHVGVGAGGGEAIELADFRAHLRRERHGHFRQTLREDGADASLVGRVRVGVQQADGDTRHPLAPRAWAPGHAPPVRRATPALRRRRSSVPARCGGVAGAQAAAAGRCSRRTARNGSHRPFPARRGGRPW